MDLSALLFLTQLMHAVFSQDSTFFFWSIFEFSKLTDPFLFPDKVRLSYIHCKPITPFRCFLSEAIRTQEFKGIWNSVVNLTPFKRYKDLI